MFYRRENPRDVTGGYGDVRRLRRDAKRPTLGRVFQAEETVCKSFGKFLGNARSVQFNAGLQKKSNEVEQLFGSSWRRWGDRDPSYHVLELNTEQKADC